MIESRTEQSPATVQQPGLPAADAVHTRNGSASALAGLALIAAMVAVSLHFYPELRRTAETYAGPLPWLPERIGSGFGQTAVQLPGGATALMALPPEFADMQTSLAKLSQDVAQLDSVKADAGNSLKASEEAGKQITALQGQFSALQTASAKENAEFKSAVTSLQAEAADIKAGLSRLDDSYAKLSAPNDAALIAAKLTLLAVNGALTPDDIDPLARLVGSDPALAEAAAQVKALTGEDVLTITALQVQFDAAKDEALERAKRLQLSWLQSGVSAAHAMMADLGFMRADAEGKDELVITEASRQMNNGRLERAMFELQAASPELRQQLAPWMSAAQLRINLDTSLQRLIEGLLQRRLNATGVPGAG